MPQCHSRTETDRPRTWADHGNGAVAQDVELDFRHSGWWSVREKVRKAMTAAGAGSRAQERFDNCGALAWVYKNTESGDYKVRGSYCHCRWCIPCAQAKSLQVADRLQAKIGTARGLHIVVTLRHHQDELSKQIRRLTRCLSKLRARKEWKRQIPGGAWFVQCHPSERDGLWHVHAHLFCQGKFLDVRWLSTEWEKITGDSTNVRVQKMLHSESLAREVARYVARPFERSLVDHTDLFAELMVAMKGTHLCSTFGTWRGFELTKAPAGEENGAWVAVKPLPELVRDARAGDVESLIILRKILTKSHPSIGPPELLAIDAPSVVPN